MGGGSKAPDNSAALEEQRKQIEAQNKLIEQQMEEARQEREKQKKLNQMRADEESAEKERQANLIKEQSEIEQNQDKDLKDQDKNIALGNTDVLDVDWLNGQQDI
ncbi:MAG: hypothetical protein ACRCYT_09555 [Cetobacterium sp.]